MAKGITPGWRLLLTGFGSPYMNMAIDESILVHRSRGENPPTIRVYGWATPTVSIGYFQKLEEEVDLRRAMEFGVRYVRRITGGGAVLHEYEATYSLVASDNDPKIPRGIQESIELICRGIVLGLKRLGIDAEFKPVNDVVVGGRKISGNAQTRRLHTVLQHGTVLLDVDYQKTFSVLKRSAKTMEQRSVDDLRKALGGINEILEEKVSFQRLSEELVKGFEEELKIELVEGELSESEKNLADQLAASKYSKREWNHRF